MSTEIITIYNIVVSILACLMVQNYETLIILIAMGDRVIVENIRQYLSISIEGYNNMIILNG